MESNYTITIELSKPNFIPFAPSGWSYPLIPRNNNDCTSTNCILSPILQGDAPQTWLNYYGKNDSPVQASVSSFRIKYFLDDEMLWFLDQSGPIPANGSFYDVNTGAFTIKGGRHTLGVYVDELNNVSESNETDNTFYKQFVFSPFTLTGGVANQRTHPPKRFTTGASYFNCDGYQYSTGWWGVVSIVPTSSIDNYDLQLHNDYTGSEGGFETFLKQSNYEPGISDFVMTNANNPSVPYGSMWYACVRQAYDIPVSTGDYFIQEVNSMTAVVPPGIFGPYNINANNLLGVHEILFNASSVNRNYFFRLLNEGGNSNLGFGVYGPSQPYYSKDEALALSDLYSNGQDEYFLVNIPAEGYYGLVVWKNGTQDLPLSSQYRYAAIMVLPHRIAQNSLRVLKSNSQPGLELIWGSDCNAISSTNYSIYIGDLDSLHSTGTYDYTAERSICNAGNDLTEYIPMPNENVFFIVTPNDGFVEGSYGINSNNNERPPASGSNQCHPQLFANECID